MEQNYKEVKLTDIRPSPFNPRKRFGGPKMDELITSVKAQGVIEPVLIRPVYGGDVPFELVAGERRWRAANAAAAENGGLENYRIPALVRKLGDDEAFELMMIENLQREDLNEREEAEGFEAYLQRKGEGSLDELAERTGLSARYIRRRTAVLRLPKKALKHWEKGNLSYSHLEQFLRIKEDKTLVASMIEQAVDWGSSAREIKDEIDRMSPRLSQAIFDIAAAGCGTCRHNSDVQRQLFDLDADGKKCLKPECFKQQLNNYLQAHWEKSDFFKEFGTRGFRFYKGVGHGDYTGFHVRGPWKACRSCDNFVTLIDEVGRVFTEKVCLDPACCKRRQAAGDRKNEAESYGEMGGAAEPDEPRVAWHGEHFREKFYQASIPQRFFERIKTTVNTPDAVEIKARLGLFAMLKSNSDLHVWLAGRLGIEVDEDQHWYRMEDEALFAALAEMDYGRLLDLESETILEYILQIRFGSLGRRLVAEHIGIDLKTEFRVDEEYLQKKTKAEIIGIGEQFGVFEQKCVKDFLFETLLKKRGKYKSCKKSELIRLFLESGADLAGVVPAEILGE